MDGWSTAKGLRLPADSFAGQVVLVTGAGQGIGREIALAFACLGARVVVAELAGTGQETADEIGRRGGKALFVRTDVSSPASVSALAGETHRQFGPVDVLVNNAMLCPAIGVTEMEPELWDRVMAVNLRGTFLTCRAFLPDMLAPDALARGRGTILNLVSTDAMPGLSAYIASKQGITGFSQSLAAEVGEQGVRVIAFGPGMVDTPGIRAVADGLAPRLGLTPGQFLSMPLHPAYPGLMPPGHAGAAAVYLAAVLADEFHGEVVTGYTILERAGLIQAAGEPASEPVPSEPVDNGPAASGPASQPALTGPGGLEQARRLSRALEELIAATGVEFDRLPIFVRPMARSGFKGKAGASLADWERTAAALSASLAGPGLQPGWAGRLPRTLALLEKLIGYFEGVPAETSRFTKDPEMLRQVRELTRARVETLRALMQTLDRLG